ncbi:MAG TPA: type III-B CRISPR module RAMP protein Cmr6 [Terriglobia bacterium]|nr:type III-B CRISPR module RAMP protein Cmr6 [Terriglobia bacterium]
MPSKQTSPGPTRTEPGQDGQPAVPCYVPGDFSSAPPGHRYLLYLPFWRKEKEKEWSAIKEGKQKALNELITLPPDGQRLMRELAARQRKIGEALGAKIVSAESISPFATGLGWEHPNENGFAFLNPYGLPYLAGSGVKGVLRKAVEEMALFGSAASTPEDDRWSMLDVWWLFGFEGASGAIWESGGEWVTAFDRHMETVLQRPDLAKFLSLLKIPNEGTAEKLLCNLKQRRRDLQLSGAIRFFDVIPELAENKLGVDIMNPHHGDYYQGNSTPHDAGNPVPIFFLVVPPGSKFTFVVDGPREQNLPEVVRRRWRKLLDAAFERAFAWLGFGAKTAVGYGAMRPVSSLSAGITSQQGQQLAKTPALTPEERAIAKLCELYEEHKKYGGPSGGPFPNARIELLRQAKNWEVAESCQRLLDLIEETLIEYPWAGKKEKMADREREMEALRRRIQELRSRKAP